MALADASQDADFPSRLARLMSGCDELDAGCGREKSRSRLAFGLLRNSKFLDDLK